MHDVTDGPAPLPAPPRPTPAPSAFGRGVLLLLLGMGLGVGLTVGAFVAFTFFTRTLPSARESAQVFGELNELRVQLNQLNEERRLKEQEKEEAIRQALDAAAASARAADGRAPSAGPADKNPGGRAEAPAPPVVKPHDPFADVDAELERLEQTQKVLNTMLDLLTRKNREAEKARK